MPETTDTLSRSKPVFSSAVAKHWTTVPMPQPGHQTCGIRSIRR